MQYFDLPIRETSMTCYLLDNSEQMPYVKERPLVIVCPGGAYIHRSPREAEPVAMRLLAAGFHAAILHYSVAPARRYPTAALQLAQAVREVRAHAKAWGVTQVYIMGFSAGGHLCGTLGTLWDEPVFHEALGGEPDWRPDGQILCYPVITMGEKTHGGSRENLLAERMEELQEALSLEKRVSEKTVRTFLWHTAEDGSVPVENSLHYACALRQAGVPFELHVYEQGEHGLSLCDKTTSTHEGQLAPDNAGWMDKVIRFIARKA